MLSESELEWLRANKADTRERWAYTENSRPFIDSLCDQGLMKPALGEFKMREAAEPQEMIKILDKEVPIIGEMISLYVLTPAGRQALEDQDNG